MNTLISAQGRRNGEANHHDSCTEITYLGFVMRRDDENAAKEIITMKEERKILRWLDRVRSRMKEHHNDTKLTQKRED